MGDKTTNNEPNTTMNELVREIEKSYTRSGEHNVTTQYKAAFYDLAEKFDLLLKERNTLSEWNQCTMNAGGDLVKQIAQLTKERDELAAKSAEMRNALNRLNDRVHTGYDFNADPGKITLLVGNALSEQCGQGWLSPEQKKVLVEALEGLFPFASSYASHPLRNPNDKLHEQLDAAKQALEGLQ